jgi:hypothetical protein
MRPHVDPLRGRMLELVQDVGEHAEKLREYASVPGNAWLAKGEAQILTQLASELDEVLSEIKADDAENGY